MEITTNETLAGFTITAVAVGNTSNDNAMVTVFGRVQDGLYNPSLYFTYEGTHVGCPKTSVERTYYGRWSGHLPESHSLRRR